MINDIFYVPVRWHIDVIIDFKKKFPGLIPGIFYTFLIYFAEANPKYFPTILM